MQRDGGMLMLGTRRIALEFRGEALECLGDALVNLFKRSVRSRKKRNLQESLGH